jgi:hypothetical protein
MIDLATAQGKVNASNKNKTVLFDRRRFGRMKCIPVRAGGKECSAGRTGVFLNA